MAQLNIRLSDDDRNRVQRLKEKLQAKYGGAVHVTERTVILEALSMLEGYFAKLERDKGRGR